MPIFTVKTGYRDGVDPYQAVVSSNKINVIKQEYSPTGLNSGRQFKKGYLKNDCLNQADSFEVPQYLYA